MEVSSITTPSGSKLGIKDEKAREDMTALKTAISALPSVEVNADTATIAEAVNLLMSKFHVSALAAALCGFAALGASAAVEPLISPHAHIWGDVQIVTNTVELLAEKRDWNDLTTIDGVVTNAPMQEYPWYFHHFPSSGSETVYALKRSSTSWKNADFGLELKNLYSSVWSFMCLDGLRRVIHGGADSVRLNVPDGTGSYLERYASATVTTNFTQLAKESGLQRLADEFGIKGEVKRDKTDLAVYEYNVNSELQPDAYPITYNGMTLEFTLTENGQYLEFGNYAAFNRTTGLPEIIMEYGPLYNGRSASFVDGYPRLLPASAGDTLAKKSEVPTAAERAAWTAKQDAIADLDDIRSGAAAGATALPSANAYTDGKVAAVTETVRTWENFLDGSNVVFSVTNYQSGAYVDGVSKLRILELRDGEYREIYDSRADVTNQLSAFQQRVIDNPTNSVASKVTVVSNRIESVYEELQFVKADRAWGKYTSAGGEAPSNTVYLTAPNTVFAGGMEYERVAVGEGTICVLADRGQPVWAQGDEGTFRFQSSDGKNYFGFTKTDSYVIGCQTDGISVKDKLVTLTFNVTMQGVPCVWYKPSLDNYAATEWEQLNTSDGRPVEGASHAVAWEENPPPGKEICYLNCPEPKGFFRATIEVVGSASFETNMKANLKGGVLCTDGVTVIYPHADGTWSPVND